MKIKEILLAQKDFLNSDEKKKGSNQIPEFPANNYIFPVPLGITFIIGAWNYHGEAGFTTFSHSKGILDKPFWFESALKYPLHTRRKPSILKYMME